MLRRLFISTFVLFCFASLLCAQAEQSDPSGEQEIRYSVNVTADRLEEPLKDKSDSITVITREDIERHEWRFVSDALRDVPGITLVQSGSAGKTTSAFIRGASADQLLVLVDGIPVNDPYFGDVMLANITTDNIERIEIVRGPQSPLYGSDSIGGVINIITRAGENGFQPQFHFEAGSLQTFRESAGLSGGLDQFRYSLSFARQDSEGQFDNDELRESSISAKASYDFEPATEISFVTRVHDSQIGIPFNSSYEPAANRNQESKLSLFGTHLRHSTGNYLNVTARVSLTHIDFLFEDPEDFFPLSKHDSNVVQAALQNDFQLGSNDVLITGFEFEKQSIDASDQNGPIADLNDFDSEIYSFFAQNKFQNRWWIFTAGLRFDHHSSFGDTVNPRISVALLPDSKWKIRGAAATGFRAPTAGDLLYPFYGNPELKPEKSKSWEIGIDRSLGERASFSATWFYNKFRDLISFDPNTFVAGNVLRAKSQGLELSGNVDRDPWHVVAAYTYLNSEDEVEDHPLLRRPEHFGSVRVAYEVEKWGGSLRVLGIGQRLETDFRVFPTKNVFNPGYVRVDAAGHLKLSSAFRLFGRIENLLAKDYEEALTFQAPGISFFGGIDFSL